MVSVMKSPNMMSTTERSPVMAAPTLIPVKPASEMGVSITRSEPNSATSPDKTLNGVPASATSSPRMQTRVSRRISSARASRTACAKVSSRSGIHILFGLVGRGIRSIDCELYRGFHLGPCFCRDLIQGGGVGKSFGDQPLPVDCNGIAFVLPVLLFLFGAVILAIDVSHVVAAITIRIGLQECGPLAFARMFHKP